jgi:dUTP pyrophosphatase
MKKPISIDYICEYELSKGNEYAAGIDLKITDDIIIKPEQTIKVSSKLAIDIPKGYFGMLVPRSSFGINYPNLIFKTGIIDCDYVGEMSFVILNSKPRRLFKNNSIKLDKDQRIAQLILIPYLDNINLVKADTLKQTTRGASGFGSTGK